MRAIHYFDYQKICIKTNPREKAQRRSAADGVPTKEDKFSLNRNIFIALS